MSNLFALISLFFVYTIRKRGACCHIKCKLLNLRGKIRIDKENRNIKRISPVLYLEFNSIYLAIVNS